MTRQHSAQKKRPGNSRYFVPPTLEDKHSLKVKRVGAVPPEFENESHACKSYTAAFPKKVDRMHAKAALRFLQCVSNVIRQQHMGKYD